MKKMYVVFSQKEKLVQAVPAVNGTVDVSDSVYGLKYNPYVENSDVGDVFDISIEFRDGDKEDEEV